MVKMKIFHQSKNNENESIEMNSINDQSSSSEQKSIQQRVFRKKYTSDKWRNSMTNPLKSRRKILSKALITSGDNLIQVNKHISNSTSRKKKHNKQHARIIINVSGKHYQTYSSTLENYPNTLLGNKQKRMYYWDEQEGEYFFDRHRACFEAILYYYQSNGRLRRPDYVPLDTFLEEVSFFDLGPQAVSQIDKSENVSIIKYIDLPNWFWRRYIWFYLEHPQHSIFGRILHLISMLLTIVSCITLAVETLPKYNEKYTHLCDKQENTTSSNSTTSLCLATLPSPFFIIQTICVSYFTIEFILRLISAPSYYRFILSIYNWVDLSSIIPYFIITGLELHHHELELRGSLITALRVLRILRFLRLVKIYLIFSQLKSLRVLSSTLKESFADFIIMIIILTLLAFMFGTATYFAEENHNEQVFDSIPKATYWGITTITTTGYGDMYPITVLGRVFACACAYFGVATGGILISILVDRYQRVYNRKKFFPEQIIPAVDPNESEHDEKQDFINKRLTEPNRVLSNKQILPPTPAPSISSQTYNRQFSRYSALSSQIQFIISLTGNETNDQSIYRTANELLTELTQAVNDNNENINFKLIGHKRDSLNGRISTANEESSSNSQQQIF
ncbi:unnamed protein product [Rotaria sordida]|uniref:BTB domain-containing protein n=2 Tax=Rotaria sordida TaxID=392033 RepID=A0A819HAF8_9BILA|nr:unnamed protein product [Rotaria sordida]